VAAFSTQTPRASHQVYNAHIQTVIPGLTSVPETNEMALKKFCKFR
jgi:hypothetical protein